MDFRTLPKSVVGHPILKSSGFSHKLLIFKVIREVIYLGKLLIKLHQKHLFVCVMIMIDFNTVFASTTPTVLEVKHFQICGAIPTTDVKIWMANG